MSGKEWNGIFEAEGGVGSRSFGCRGAVLSRTETSVERPPLPVNVVSVWRTRGLPLPLPCPCEAEKPSICSTASEDYRTAQ